MHNHSQFTHLYNSCLMHHLSPRLFQTSCPSFFFITHPVQFVRPCTGHSQPTRRNILKENRLSLSRSPKLSTSLWPKVGLIIPSSPCLSLSTVVLSLPDAADPLIQLLMLR